VAARAVFLSGERALQFLLNSIVYNL